ncbi:MAG: peroxidase-related enzyme [Bdellovibrio sp.]|nr:peroxidase-related enzyme [Bdellovibrio sp.]
MNARFAIHQLSTVAEELRPLLEATQKKMGFLPNLLGAMAESPDLTKAFLHLLQQAGHLSLSAQEREVIILTISVENGCDYCAAQHRQIMRKFNFSEDDIEKVLRKQPLENPQLRALQEFTLEALHRKGAVPKETQERFFACGYTQKQALEIIFLIGTYSMSNFANHLLQVPLDDAFKG